MTDDERDAVEEHIQHCELCTWVEPTAYQLARVSLRRRAASAGGFALAAAAVLCRAWQGTRVEGDDAQALMTRAAAQVVESLNRGGAEVPDGLVDALALAYAAGAAQMVEAQAAAAEHAAQATAGETRH